MKSRELKSGYLAYDSSMYHLAVEPIRVHWNSLSLMKSSMMLLDENHKWNHNMVLGTFPYLAFKLGDV